MTENRMLGKVSPIVVRASLRLDESLTDLDALVERQNLHQKKANALAKQIDALSRSQLRDWTATTHDKLIAVTARYETEQKFLDKARKSIDKARQSYSKALDGYVDAFDRQHAMLAELRAALEDKYLLNAALSRALDDLFGRQWLAGTRSFETAGQDASFDVPDGSYDYIALDVSRFFALLIHLDRYLSVDPVYADPEARYRPVSLLEIGCGPGRNVLLARASGLCNFGDITGFDINETSVEIGRQTFGLEDQLGVADALSFDYGGYDVIYSYRPFSDVDLQARLEAQIARTMQKDAYLVAPFSYDLGLYPDLVPAGQSPDIWRKVR